MSVFRQLFPQTKCPKLIGMVHVRALPGTPGYAGSMSDIMDKASEEAQLFSQFDQIDGLIVENMHDAPYVQVSHILAIVIQQQLQSPVLLEVLAP